MRRAKFYELLYRRWKRGPDPQAGYSLLLLVPGDLPVFTQLAMTVCAQQESEERVETLVLPDVFTSGFRRVFDQQSPGWSGSLKVLRPRRLEEIVARRRQNPHFNTWLQLKAGINNARGTHAIWHDSDLFLRSPGFLDDHYRTCRDRDLALLGVSQAYEEFRRQGFPHVVSTWELIFKTAWAREFMPWEHRGHDGHVNGQPVTFDLMFCPQTQTAPERISRHPTESGFLHFNYTIGTYRAFQRSLRRGDSWDDSGFRVLLVRLLADALDDSDWMYDAPPVAELLAGLEDTTAKVTYVNTDRAGYDEFRNKLQELIEGGFLERSRTQALADGIRPFDEAYGWQVDEIRQ